MTDIHPPIQTSLPDSSSQSPPSEEMHAERRWRAPGAATRRRAERLARWIIIGPVLSVAVLAAGAALFLHGGVGKEQVLIPTLELTEAPVARLSLLGNLTGENGGVTIDAIKDMGKLFTIKKDRNALIKSSSNTTTGLKVAVAFGDPKMFKTQRFWGYKYSGNEVANKAKGLTGLALFDGKFFFSDGELKVTGAQYGHLNTPNFTIEAGQQYYVKSADDLPSCFVDEDGDDESCIEDRNGNGVLDAGETDPKDADTDDDGLHDGKEVTLSINPLMADTDGDGIQDGMELGLTAGISPGTDLSKFIPDADPQTTTDPLKADTDGGGTVDGGEDKNGNGKLDPGETDPKNAVDDPAAQPVCGDGKIKAPEQCDDGNTTAGDGCSKTCAVEPGFTCTGFPSVCAPGGGNAP